MLFYRSDDFKTDDFGVGGRERDVGARTQREGRYGEREKQDVTHAQGGVGADARDDTVDIRVGGEGETCRAARLAVSGYRNASGQLCRREP